jgi:hypothetical protein
MRQDPSWTLILLTAGVIILLNCIWPQALGEDRLATDAVVPHYEQTDHEQCAAQEGEGKQGHCNRLEALHEDIA